MAKGRQPKRTTAKDSSLDAIELWRRLNRVQLAQLLGVHPDTVTDYARQGMPVVSSGGRGKESVYDAVECLDWWRARQGKNAKEAAQTKLYEANARRAELKHALESGEVWKRDDIIADGQMFVKGWTALVRALPKQARRSGIVTADAEPLLAGLCRRILDEISRWQVPADVERSIQDADAA